MPSDRTWFSVRLMGKGSRRAAILLSALLVAAAAMGGCSTATTGDPVTDSSSAFAAFTRPQHDSDTVPATLWNHLDSTVPDVHTDRRVATSKDLTIYLVHAEPDWLCLVTDEVPGHDTVGGEGCSPGSIALSQGMWMTFGTADPNPVRDRTVFVVPDGFTATITKGTFVMVGQGVLVVQGNGVDAVLSNADGRTLHLSSPTRTQR